MVPMQMQRIDDITFHTFLPWFLSKLVFLLLFAVMCFGFAFQTHALWWLGVLSAMGLAVGLSVHYSVEAVILRSDHLVFRDGFVWISEQAVALDHVALDIRQNLLGHLFDYGTIVQTLDSKTITVRNIAGIRALRMVLAERQRYLTGCGRIQDIVQQVITLRVFYGPRINEE
ncbi:MAG: hypothetical protein M3R24_38935 [Chloroflexota bacterium]|nr:hypothetical protein [Chloroflexota bacterium]